MSSSAARARRGSLFWALLIGLGSTAVAVGIERTDLLGFRAMERGAYDRAVETFTRNEGRSERVVLVAIDDRTFSEVRLNESMALEFGTWPYFRSFWLYLVQHLVDEGARAVALDVVMDEPHTDPKGDQQLGEAVARHGLPLYIGVAESPSAPALPAVTARNVLPAPRQPPEWVVPRPQEPQDTVEGEVSEDLFDEPVAPRAPPEAVAQALAFPVTATRLTLPTLPTKLDSRLQQRASNPIRPIPQLVGALPGFGLVISEEDEDGVLRRTRFAYSDGANHYVTLPMAVAADLLGAEQVELSPGRLTFGSRSMRINTDGSALIDYGGSVVERFEMVSAFDVLNDFLLKRAGQPRVLPGGIFKDRVVLIGGTAVGTADVKATPFSSYVPGMVKQASVLDSLLGGRFIVQAPYAGSVALALGCALLAAFGILLTRSIFVEIAALPAVMLLAFGVTGLALATWQVHLLTATAGLAGLVASLSSIAVNHLLATRDRERLRASFSKFLSREVAAQLADQEELPKLAGERMPITAFFSDIRGFSTFSERFKDDPEALVAILNTYLTRVTGVLQADGACLDKYIGDAVVCLFGAPVRHPDHALRACRGALAAQAEVSRLREEFATQGLPDMYTRIGLNTASMFVGNIGSEQLFNYTAIGDGMNLAARLEGANKNYGTTIMIGPATYEQASAHIEARELDWVRVAGKTEPVAVYELLGLKGGISLAKTKVVESYARGLAEYRAGRFAQALEWLDQALAVDPEDGPSRALAQRCGRYLEQPPPQPFDGVANLEK